MLVVGVEEEGGSLERLKSMDSFDAEIPPSLKGLSVLAPVPPHSYPTMYSGESPPIPFATNNAAAAAAAE